MRILSIAAFVLGVAGVVVWASREPVEPHSSDVIASGEQMVNVTLPATLSANSEIGKSIFEAKCAVCHGMNAAGKNGAAPPLTHKVYEPSHHADESFQRAVALGVRQHHWSFGNMPPVEGLTRGDVAMIVSYVRELQQANGIH